jgi:hypothetical protein
MYILYIGTWSDFVAIVKQLHHTKNIEDGIYILQKMYQESAFYFVATAIPPPLISPKKMTGSGGSTTGGGFYPKKDVHYSSQESIFSPTDK